MVNILEKRPSNKPILVTQGHLDLMRARFEREVIDPLFFGRLSGMTDEGAEQVQSSIDGADRRFRELVAENFELSSQEE